MKSMYNLAVCLYDALPNWVSLLVFRFVADENGGCTLRTLF